MSSDFMNAEHTITNIVEAMLPRGTYERLGLKVCVEISATDYGSEDSDFDDQKTAWRQLQFIFVRPSNYTQVYVKEITNRQEDAKWELHSDHDSCWRSDGLRKVFKCLSEVCRAIAPNKPFVDADPRITIDTFGGISYVLLKERLGDSIFGAIGGEPRRMSYYYDRDSREVTHLEVEERLSITEAIPYLQEKSCMGW